MKSNIGMVYNMENYVQQQDCLDSQLHQLLLTRKHICWLDSFDFLHYQNVIHDMQDALYTGGLYISLYLLLQEH